MKDQARMAAMKAKMAGTLVPPGQCTQCGAETKLEMHHPDYSKPLDVVWLCMPCHRALHGPGGQRKVMLVTQPEAAEVEDFRVSLRATLGRVPSESAALAELVERALRQWRKESEPKGRKP